MKLAGRKGAPYDAVFYSGTKAALVEWSSGLRPELRGTGVGSSVISPGYVTGEGMFARFGKQPPALQGSCTPVACPVPAVPVPGRAPAQHARDHGVPAAQSGWMSGRATP